MDAAPPAQARTVLREGGVLLVYSEAKRKHYIIVRPACSSKAHLVRVHPESGELTWDQAVGRDTFESESAALKYLQDQSRAEVTAHGKALLGYVVLGPVALLLVAEAVRVSALLPGGHQIKTVTQSRWHRINLQQPELDPTTQAATKAELDRGVDKTTSFPVDGAHYYCDSLDITRPFPSDRAASDPSWAFVWNRALSAPFRAVGLSGPDTVCPPLLQGMAESRELEDFDGCRFSYCLISRKCRLHVGPRYKARGLNDVADPGNEIECDQVVWKHAAAPDKPLAWSRYTWRRGSVPLWWSVTIRNGGMGEAEIKIHTTNTFRGSRRYVRRLQRRYTPNPALDPPPPDEGAEGGSAGGGSLAAAAVPGSSQWRQRSLQVPVVFFSLLRKGTPDRDRSEAKLAEAFDYLAGQLRSLHKLPVGYVALDWHQMDKELGSEALVEAFWTQLGALLPPQGFALGTMSKVGPDHADADSGLELSAATLNGDGDGQAGGSSTNGGGGSGGSSGSSGQDHSPVGRGWCARWFKQQQGVTRYNCADSLDRTNVGSFFGAVQVFVEQCRELDIAISATSAGAASMARQALLRRQAAAAAAAAADGGALVAGGIPAGASGSRPPSAGAGGLGGGAAGAAQQQHERRPGSGGSGVGGGGSSGFLTSLGKGLMGGVKGMGELRISNSSPRASPRDLATELRSNSSSNVAMLAREQQQQPSGSSLGGQPEQQQQSREQQLPPGWEAKYDAVNKRIFYVDHNTKTTTWTRPACSLQAPAAAAAAEGQQQQQPDAGQQGGQAGGSPQQQQQDGDSPASAGAVSHGSAGSSSAGAQVAGWSGAAAGGHHRRHKSGGRPGDDLSGGSDSDTAADKGRYEPLTPWCMFSPKLAKVRRFARMINPAALSAIAELFLMNGDMCAWLYTGSPAMHSEKITLFEPESSRLKRAGAGTYGNSFIAIRRRYNNVVMDDERKQQADIFLGLKSRLYFPTLPLPYREPDGPLLDDYPESDEDAVQQQQDLYGRGYGSSSGSGAAFTGTHDPLGDLTWPLESSKAVSRGASSQLLALGQGVGSSAAAAAAAAASAAGAGLGGLLAGAANRGRSAERQRAATVSQIGEDGTEVLAVEAQRNRGHHRSFSSEKILGDYRAQQQQQLVQQQQQQRGPASALLPPPPAAATTSRAPASALPPPPPAATAAAAPAAAASRPMTDFDEELLDGAPAVPLVPAAAAAGSSPAAVRGDPLGVLL